MGTTKLQEKDLCLLEGVHGAGLWGALCESFACDMLQDEVNQAELLQMLQLPYPFWYTPIGSKA